MAVKKKRRGKVGSAGKLRATRSKSAAKSRTGPARKPGTVVPRERAFWSAIISRAFSGICVCHNVPEYPFVRFTVWNDPMTRITGYAMEEINKLGWYQTLYPDPAVREKAIARMTAMRKGDDIVSEEWTINGKGGRKRTVAISTSVLFSVKGQTHVLAFMSDITEQKRAEAALRYKAEFEGLLTGISARFINLSPDEILPEMERALGELANFTGVERGHVMTITPEFTEFSCIAEYAAPGIQRYGQFFQNVPISIIPDWFKKIRRQEVLYIPDFKKEFHPGPKLKEVFASLEMMSVIEIPIISSGKLLGILGLVSNSEKQWPEDHISLLRVVAEIFGNSLERKKMESSLRQSEGRYRGLFDNAPIPIMEDDYSAVKSYADQLKVEQGGNIDRYLADNPGAVLECMKRIKTLSMNQAAQKMFGVRDNQELMKVLPKLSTAQTFADFGKGVRAMVQGKTRLDVETQLKTAYGDMRDVIVRWSVPPGYEQSYARVLVLIVDITESKRAEAALRQSEYTYRKIIGTTIDGFWYVDAEGRFLDVNSAACSMLGYTRDELLKMRVADIEAAEKPEAVVRHIQKMREEGGDRFESLHRRKDGAVMHVEVITSFITDAQGLERVLVFARDITERKMAEQALRESEEKYRTLFESAPESITILDLDLKVLDSNSYFGSLREEFIGANWLDYFNISKEERKFIHAVNQRILAGEKIGAIERKAVLQGRERWLEFHISVLRKDGRAWGYQAIAKDITERKMAEQALRESEEKYRTLFETAPISVTIVGLDGTIQASNDYIQIPKEVIIGKNFRDLKFFPPEYIKFLNESFTKLLKVEQYGPVEIKMALDDEHELWLESYGSLLKKEGKPYAVQVIARDITEHKKLQEQFLQAQKMEAIGRLAGGVAHDFNNQLMVIMTVVEMLEMSMDQDDPRLEKTDMIKKATEQSAALTKQLLAFSRKQIIEPVVLNLNEVLANLEKMLGRLIGEDVVLKILPDPAAGPVRVDLVQIEQVIINLAVNARDAMPRGGTLTIETANVFLDEEYVKTHPAVSAGPFVMVAVTDTGTGMDKSTRSRIFEPFFTTKEMGKGTGLGLATVYGIIKQFGGDIFVYSEPDSGTTFKIYLPRLEGSAGKPERREKIAPAKLSGSETVLVIEDEDMVRETTVIILKEHGYRVLEAPGGEQALKLVRAHEGAIDLVVTDVVMPGISGKEFARRLFEFRPEIKVLYVSGYTDNVIAHHGILDPGINFLQKPFTIESLLKKAREILDAASK